MGEKSYRVRLWACLVDRTDAPRPRPRCVCRRSLVVLGLADDWPTGPHDKGQVVGCVWERVWALQRVWNWSEGRGVVVPSTGARRYTLASRLRHSWQ